MPSMLTKIVVRSVGVLKAFDTPNTPALERLTTIYGKNGRGKTTLSAVLRSASMGKHAVVNGRKTFGADAATIHVALKFSDTKTVFFKNGKWSQSSAPIEVFDASFIADNLFAGESVGLNQDRGLFSVILGREGVKLARQQEFFVAAAKRTGGRRHSIPILDLSLKGPSRISKRQRERDSQSIFRGSSLANRAKPG